MAKRENLKSNKIAPTLFVGVGGIGGRIIRGVAELSKNDDKKNTSFIIFDTDKNDLDRIAGDLPISKVQTSSTRNIKAYMSFDKDANDNWFPNNRILDSKTVSEGAGQVRAISRLALNASIRQNKIKDLYDAIDKLYLKDGSEGQRAIKVIIATTATGGTGSGIALEIGMLVRDYVATKYPESSAIIRGFFIMPGVMRTKIKSEKEMDSQERNGYSTIKEINAFMMKGSGFFDSNPDLARYKGLNLSVPTTDGSIRTLDNLPFDFCFLIEKSDANQKSMESLSQYEELVSRCIYEQNISILSKKASSQEDNVIKTFIDPELLGRSRFGSVGASVLRYPYEEIRDYVAYTWAEKNILGVRNINGVSNEDLVKNTWIACDKEYRQLEKEYENGVINNKPERGTEYLNSIDSSASDFAMEIKDRQIHKKYEKYVNEDNRDGTDEFKTKVEKIASQYLDNLTEALVINYQKSILTSNDSDEDESEQMNGLEDILNSASSPATKGHLGKRYRNINKLNNVNLSNSLDDKTKNFLKMAFESNNAFTQDVNIKSVSIGKEIPFSIENYISLDEKSALHPNAIRALLYSLSEKMAKGSNQIKSSEDYASEYNEINSGRKVKNDKKGDKANTKEFQVKGNFGKETDLKQMCDAADDAEDNKAIEVLDSNAFNRAQRKLNDLYDLVNGRTSEIARYRICKDGKAFVDSLIKAYENFYDSFERKISLIDKKKKEIVSSIEYHNGDCVKNLFASRQLLDVVVENCVSSKDNGQLYVDIYKAIKDNAITEKKRIGNPLLMEATKDIFNDVIIENYKKDVEKNCANEIDLDILHAMKYQFEISQLVKAQNENDEEAREAIIRDCNNKDKRNKYINDILKEINILATPSLAKANDKEDREVSAMAYGAGVNDEDGSIRIDDFTKYLDKENKSDAISKYELHCFRSTYGLTPEDITSLGYVKPESDGILYSSNSGEYFKKYQEYMNEIGPDSRINPIITTHIDRRWNSISVMPEMDLDYQKMLMGHIHEAYFYGFVYGAIAITSISRYEEDNKVYCFDNDGRKNRLYVSDGTNCNELYKIVDSLYFDRKLVEDIHNIANASRAKTESRPSEFKDTTFASRIAELKRSSIVISNTDLKDDIKMSIFELPALYYGSLPARKKDAAELKTMVWGIMYALLREIKVVNEINDAKVIWKQLVIEHFNLLQENHNKIDELKVVSSDVIESIKDHIASYLSKNNVGYKKEDFKKSK